MADQDRSPNVQSMKELANVFDTSGGVVTALGDFRLTVPPAREAKDTKVVSELRRQVDVPYIP